MIYLHDGAGCSGSAQEPMPQEPSQSGMNEEPMSTEQSAPEQGTSGDMPEQQA